MRLAHSLATDTQPYLFAGSDSYLAQTEFFSDHCIFALYSFHIFLYTPSTLHPQS